jgi:hypothetical protein
MFARREPHDSAAAASAHLAKDKPPGFAGKAGNQGDKQTSGYSEHLSHPHMFRHSKRRMGEG